MRKTAEERLIEYMRNDLNGIDLELFKLQYFEMRCKELSGPSIRQSLDDEKLAKFKKIRSILLDHDIDIPDPMMYPWNIYDSISWWYFNDGVYVENIFVDLVMTHGSYAMIKNQKSIIVMFDAMLREIVSRKSSSIKTIQRNVDMIKLQFKGMKSCEIAEKYSISPTRVSQTCVQIIRIMRYLYRKNFRCLNKLILDPTIGDALYKYNMKHEDLTFNEIIEMLSSDLGIDIMKYGRNKVSEDYELMKNNGKHIETSSMSYDDPSLYRNQTFTSSTFVYPFGGEEGFETIETVVLKPLKDDDDTIPNWIKELLPGGGYINES